MPDVLMRVSIGMVPARDDAEDHDLAPCFVRLRDYRALLAERDEAREIWATLEEAVDAERLRAERAEAGRDAEFAAGQEDMRERAAIVADLESRSCGPSYGGGYPAHTAMEITKGIRRLPIKTRP